MKIMSSRAYGLPREYKRDGSRYVVRDVLTRDDREGYSRFAGHCQYKTKRHDGVVVWLPCREGAAFSEIEPLETRS